MIIIANSTENLFQFDGLDDHTKISYCFSEESFTSKEELFIDFELNSPNIKDKEFCVKGMDFSLIRNYIIFLFEKGSEKELIYINSGLKGVTVKDVLETLLKMKPGFLFNNNKRIAGFKFDRKTALTLGGVHYLSQLLIKKVGEEEDSSLLISNEALDFDYLYRYLKYKEILSLTYKTSLDLSEEEFKAKEKFDKHPLYYRSMVDGIKISEYYMLYMNSISSFKNRIKHSEKLIKGYSKVFKRLKRDALSLKVKEAQKSFIKGFLYHKPVFLQKEGK